jgi:hypothetical protein
VIDADGNEPRNASSTSPLQLQSTVIKDDGLGRWLMILEDAADSAKEKGSRMSWGRVIVAHHLIKSVETVH